MQRKFTKKQNTLSRAVKNNPVDVIALEIGDSKQSDFFPQAKIMRWGNEVNFSIRRDNGARTYKERGNKIVAENATEDVVFYELDGFEDGGLEIELHLKEKPKTNTFVFTIETKCLDFFYQPALTPQEIEDGVERPENVIGSYAVYHKTGRNNKLGGKEYKTGKAFHIYRPHITDKNGKETWGEISIDEKAKTLTVTVPQDFLDDAAYPVIVDPTFGYTTIGSSKFNYYRLRGSVLTVPTSGNVDIQSVSWNGNGNDSGVNAKAIIVDNSTLTIVSNGVSNISQTVATGWVTHTFATDPILAGGTDVILMNIIDSNFEGVRYDTATANSGLADNSNSYTTPTDPTDGVYNTRKYSIYATYTAAATDAQLIDIQSISNISTITF